MAEQAELGLQDKVTALYIRVSTEKQVTEGFGLDAQRSELDAYCQAHEWIVSDQHVYLDAGVSGKSTDRPAFKRMMAAARAKEIGRIVTVKLDRIARNLGDLLQTVKELEQCDCALIVKKEAFDTSTPQGVFVMQMLGAVGELERSMIGERVQSGRVEKAKQGGYNGSRCPLGYNYHNGRFEVTERAQLVRDIYDMGLTGMSLRAIVRKLEDDGIPTPSGKGAWTVAGIKHILANGIYAGIAQWDGVEVDDQYPAIISKEIYHAMQERLGKMRHGERVDLTKLTMHRLAYMDPAVGSISIVPSAPGLNPSGHVVD